MDDVHDSETSYRRRSAAPRRSSAFLKVCASLAIGVCLGAQAEVTVKDAWVRATVPAQKVSAGYLTITSTEDAKIVGARSPVSKKAEIHASMMMSGVNHMHAVDAVPLPAGQAVELKPGGQHVMLMDLNRHLTRGETVPIFLTIQGKDGKRTELEVKAQVRPIGGS